MRAAHDIGRGDRFNVADLVEQVRTEQCSLCLFEEDASVPAVGQMRSPAVLKSVLPVAKAPPSAKPRDSRPVKSFTQMSAPTWLQITSALGAATNHSFSEPHSSD
jgi:hypothetical protein